MVDLQRDLSIKNNVNQKFFDQFNQYISFIFLPRIVPVKTTSPKNIGKLLVK